MSTRSGSDKGSAVSGKSEPPSDPLENANKDPPQNKPAQNSTTSDNVTIIPSVSGTVTGNAVKSDPPTEVLKKNPQNSCRSCKAIDNSRMVQCDQCDDWHHYSCVGVSQDVENEHWVCQKCVVAKATQKKKKKSVSKKEPALTVKSSKVNTKGANSVQPKKYPKDQKTTSKAVGVAGGELKTTVEDKVIQVPVAKKGKSIAESLVSGSSRKSAKTLLEVQIKRIEAEETLLEEEMMRKKELLDRKFALMEELAEVESGVSTTSEQPDSEAKVKSWLTASKQQGDIRCSGSTVSSACCDAALHPNGDTAEGFTPSP